VIDEKQGTELGPQVTRRRIVTTGAKLAYAAPLVAVSFKLTGSGALAATPICPATYTPDEKNVAFGGPACCRCTCSLSTKGQYQASDDTCRLNSKNVGPTGTKKCKIECIAGTLSL
jgi:hypothetical protein